MPAIDAAPAFAEAAAADGIELADQVTFDWLTEAGHRGLEEVAMARRDPSLREPVTAAVEVLSAIYDQFGGDSAVMRSLRMNYFLNVDLVHKPSSTVIQLDESPHFTTFRLQTLDRYPPDVKVSFDIDEYRALCREWAAQTDKLNRAFAAKGFGFGGRQLERAYRDALLDLGAPAMGLQPVVRVIALDGDGTAAYDRDRDRVRELLGA